MKNLHDILKENINSIFSKDEINEMITYHNVCELNEFIEENKDIDRNSEDYNVYILELNKRLNKLKK